MSNFVRKKLNRFDAGMWIQPDGTAIPNNACIELINMRLSEKGYPTQRFGSKKINTTTMHASYKCRGIFVNESAATDAKAYIYVACGTFLWWSTGGNFTKLAMDPAGVVGSADIVAAETAEWDAVFWNGLGYFVNGQYPVQTAPVAATTSAIKIDGTTCTEMLYVDANSWPKNLQYLTQFGSGIGGRVYGALSTSSIVYTTVVNDPEDWYDSTNNLYSYFGYEDGEDIRGLHATTDGIVIVKPHNVYTWHCMGVFTSWQQKKAAGTNPDYGCFWHRSIQPFTWKGMPGLAWLGWAGAIHFDGRDCREMSGQIRSAMKSLPQSSPTKETWTIDDMSEWDGGTIGSKQVDTFGSILKAYDHTTAADFTAGTDNETEDANGAIVDNVQTRYARLSYIIDDFEDGLASRWTTVSTAAVAEDGWMKAPSSGKAIVKIANPGGATTGYWGWKGKGTTIFQLADSSSLDDGYWLYCGDFGQLRFYKADGGTKTTIKETDTFTFSNPYTVEVKRAAGGVWTIKIDGVEKISETDNTYSTFDFLHMHLGKTSKCTDVFYEDDDPTPAGDFMSQAIDYGEDVDTLEELGNLVAEVDTERGGAVTFKTLSADSADLVTNPDAAGWVNVGVAGENGGKINSIANRYIKWRAYFTTTYAADNPKVYGVRLGTRWVSANKDLGSTPSSLGQLVVTEDIPEGSEAKYYVETAATEGGLDGTGWERIWDIRAALNHITLFSSSEDWFRFKIVLNSTDYEAIPTVDAVTFEYFVGNTVDSPAAKTIQGIYHLAVDEAGTGDNDAVYVCNESGAWAKDTQLNISGWNMFKNRIVVASSTEGFARWMYEGDNDDGAVIPYKLVTRDEYIDGSEQGYENMDKCFRRINPTYKSGLPVRISSKIAGEPWNQHVFDASEIIKTQSGDLNGKNTGQYIRYKIEPNVYDFSNKEDFSLDPSWLTFNGSTYMYWHEDKYLYVKAADEAATRRIYTMLPRMMNESDEMGFWVKVEPTTLQGNSDTKFCFFNTNQPTNYYDTIGVTYTEHATKYSGLDFIATDGTQLTSWSTSAFSATTVYFMDFRFSGGTMTLRVFDSNGDWLYTPSLHKSISTNTFNVNAFGIMNFGAQTGDEYTEWKIHECVPYYKPSEVTGLVKTGNMEFRGMTHEFIPLGRI